MDVDQPALLVVEDQVGERPTDVHAEVKDVVRVSGWHDTPFARTDR